MRVFVTGGRGRLGARLAHILNAQGHAVTSVDVDQMDITDHTLTRATIRDAAPDVVIHCAAMTAVDRAAEFPHEARRINGFGTQNVTLGAAAAGAALCYISSNEVFDGETAQPYHEYDTPRPINPYGASKWMGEQIVRELLSRHYIVRTSWLFAHGGQNFLHKIVALAREGKPLSVVTDEVANPTYSDDLADALAVLIGTGQFGTYHLVNDGYASRHAFAREILRCNGLTDYPVREIVLADYPRPSRPPRFAPLANFLGAAIGIRLRPWQEAVAAFFAREQTA